jgi:hypothetical protein
MRDLDEMDFSQRVILTLAIVAAALLLIFIIGYFSQEEAQGAASQQLPTKWDDHLDMLERSALDDAFKLHIGKLYSIWVTDNYQPKIPPKALTGARNARDAYIRSMDAIENRKIAPDHR